MGAYGFMTGSEKTHINEQNYELNALFPKTIHSPISKPNVNTNV